MRIVQYTPDTCSVTTSTFWYFPEEWTPISSAGVGQGMHFTPATSESVYIRGPKPDFSHLRNIRNVKSIGTHLRTFLYKHYVYEHPWDTLYHINKHQVSITPSHNFTKSLKILVYRNLHSKPRWKKKGKMDSIFSYFFYFKGMVKSNIFFPPLERA